MSKNRETNRHSGVYHSPKLIPRTSKVYDVNSSDDLNNSNNNISNNKTNDNEIDEKQNNKNNDIPSRSPSTSSRGSFSSCDSVITSTLDQDTDEASVLKQGVVFLQYGDEVIRVQLPTTNTTLETLHQLFYQAFPQHLLPEKLDIHIKNGDTGMFEPLKNIEEVELFLS